MQQILLEEIRALQILKVIETVNFAIFSYRHSRAERNCVNRENDPTIIRCLGTRAIPTVDQHANLLDIDQGLR
jgi:hypothetical protein